MKRLLILLLFALNVQAQSIDIFPKDANGQIHFEAVKDAPGKTALELYTQAKMFFVNNFASANQVIQMDDKELGIVIGNGNSSLNIPSGKYTFPISLHYTIKIECKEGKYKYSIYNLHYKSDRNTDFPAETFFNAESEAKYQAAKEKNRQVMNAYRDQTKTKIEQLETLIVSYLNKSKEESKW